MNIRTDLTIRVCIITAVFSIISYILVQRDEDIQALPILFIIFGVVVLISIVYDVHRFHAVNPKPSTESKV